MTGSRLHPRQLGEAITQIARRDVQVGRVCMDMSSHANNTPYVVLRVGAVQWAMVYDLRLVLVRVRAVKAKRAHQLSLAQASTRERYQLACE